jgi:hypothetical protein
MVFCLYARLISIPYKSIVFLQFREGLWYTGSMKEKIDSYCGLSCEDCEFKTKMSCAGCIASEGMPFWADDENKCAAAECVKTKRQAGGGLTFCGECAAFPCQTLKDYSNDPEHGDKPAGARIDRCRKLKSEKVAEARAVLPEVIAVCGLHCDLCFLGQWCGGCRGEYNCCSYATLFADKKCPNVKCAEEHGFTGPEQGCFSCRELSSCANGFFDGKNGVLAKASALFIQKHSIAELKAALKHASASGIDYNEAFKSFSLPEEAVKKMEEFL